MPCFGLRQFHLRVACLRPILYSVVARLNLYDPMRHTKGEHCDSYPKSEFLVTA